MEDGAPVGPQWFDAKLSDGHAGDGGKGDEARDQVRFAQVHGSGLSADVEVGMGDGAAADRMPVVGEDGLAIKVCQLVVVAYGRTGPSVTSGGRLHESIPVTDVEQQNSASTDAHGVSPGKRTQGGNRSRAIDPANEDCWRHA